MASYDFHPDALVEFEDATRYYLEQASPIVASAFVAAVESAIKTVIASPLEIPPYRKKPRCLT